MKLQYKAWALVLVIVGLCAFGAMLGARYIVGKSFASLETDRAQREGERARRVLDQQAQALAATTRDYAYWVDAVEFVADQFQAGNIPLRKTCQAFQVALDGGPIVRWDGHDLAHTDSPRREGFGGSLGHGLFDPSGRGLILSTPIVDDRADPTGKATAAMGQWHRELAELQMSMGVDQPGQQCNIAQFLNLAGRVQLVWMLGNLLDTAVMHDDVSVVNRSRGDGKNIARVQSQWPVVNHERAMNCAGWCSNASWSRSSADGWNGSARNHQRMIMASNPAITVIGNG